MRRGGGFERLLPAVAAAALAAACAAAPAWAQAPAPPKPPPEPSLDSKARAEIKRLIPEFFKAADEAARREVLKRIAGLDPIPASAVKEFQESAFRQAYAGARLVLKHEVSIETSQGAGKLLVDGVKAGKLQPLLIGLHGGGAGVGDGAECEQKFQPAAGKGCICVFPTVLQKTDSAWNTEREEKYVLEILEAVKRSASVDTNRVYVVGHSMGGFGSWSIGGHYADLFAAVGPCAGGVFLVLGGDKPRSAPGVLPNLHNTPVYFFHSTDDPQVGPKADQTAAEILAELEKEHPGGYKHVYKEYTNIGHGLPPEGMGPLLDYVLACKREPYPAKIVFEPVRAYKRLFAWVEVPEGSPVRRIVAECDRKRNSIAVKTEGGDKGFALYLNPGKMYDAKKELAVSVNGKEAYRGFPPSSAAALVRSVAEFRDPARVFTARLSFE